MRIAWIIACKDLRLLARDPALVFLTLGLPVLYGAFFGVIFDGIGRTLQRVRLNVALADEDDSAPSRALAAALLEAGELKVRQMSRAAAAEAVLRGELSAYIAIPAGFGGARSAAREASAIEIGVSPRRRAEAGLLRALLMRVVLERPGLADPRVAVLLGSAGLARVEGEGASLVPVAVRVIGQRDPRPENAFEVSVPQGIMWGVLACAAAFGVAFSREREQGTWTRLRVAPIRTGQVLLGKTMSCLTALTLIGTGMLALAVGVFGLRLHAPWLAFAVVPFNAIAFTGVMMLLASGPRSTQASAGLSWSVLTALGMLGGALVPTFLMPDWLAGLAQLSPVYWALEAFATAMWRGYSAADVVLPLGVLLLIGVGGLLGGWWSVARGRA